MGAATPIKAAPVQPSRELAHVRYFIDGSVDEGVCDRLYELLQAYGASPCKTLSGNLLQASHANGVDGQQASSSSELLDLDDLTHVISMTLNYKDHEAVEARNARMSRSAEESGKQATTAPGASGRRGDLIAVVTPLWVTKTCDHKKRQDEQFYSPDPLKIFSGVTVCTEGLLPGDSEAVKGIVSALGGQWRGPLVAEVTHLVCLNLEGKKSQRLLGSGLRLGMKAVLPHWIDDCIKLKLRVPEDPYMFPDPPCFDDIAKAPVPYAQRLQEFFKKIGKQAPSINNTSTSVLDPHILEGESQVSARSAAHSSFKGSQTSHQGCLTGKSIYVSQSCELSPEKLQTFLNKIKELGGEPLAGAHIQENATLLEKADVVIVNYREGWEFWKAHDSGKVIGNLDWLIYVLFKHTSQNAGTLPSPADKMLHWPWPRQPAEGFPNANFTVSGYVGPARETIKRMIELIGATFEGTLTKNKTTHLIAAVQSGSKVTHARPWGIPIVNHLWIEDSFRRWKPANLEDERYINFDASLVQEDLPSFAAGRPLDMADVESWATLQSVQQEKQNALGSLNDAIVDELDEAEEDDLLLSSPAPTSDAGTAQSSDADHTAQNHIATPSQASHVEAMMSSPLPSLRDAIRATQFPHSPAASERPSEAATLVKGPVGKGTTKGRRVRARSSASSSGEDAKPPVRRPLDPSSSASSIEPQPETNANATKRKRSNLSGLDESSLVQSTSMGYTGRRAAQAATQKLRDTIMPDVMMYEREKRGGGNKHLEEMFGGKAPSSASKKNGSSAQKTANARNGHRASQSTSGSEMTATSPAPVVTTSTRKRVRMESPATPHVSAASRAIKGRGARLRQQSPEEDEEEEYASVATKQSIKNAASVSKVAQAGKKLHIASTGVGFTESMRKSLMRMGAKLLGDNIEGCTHIIVRSMSRTVKFLSAIAFGAYFVTEDWMKDSIAAGHFLDEDKYPLVDKDGEKKHAFSLARSLSAARRSKIFDDHTFYITANVQPTFDALKQIAEAGGAKVIKRLPTAKQVTDKADVYIISSEGEKPSWEHLVAQGVRIYSGEAVIKAILQQKREFELYTIDGVED